MTDHRTDPRAPISLHEMERLMTAARIVRADYCRSLLSRLFAGVRRRRSTAAAPPGRSGARIA